MLIYHFILTIIFVYIFVQFLSMKRNNMIYNFYSKYIMNSYFIIIYILFVLLIIKYDKYTSILLLIMIIAPFKCAFKEFFNDGKDVIKSSTVKTKPNIVNNIDDRFKSDDVAKNRILKQIKSQIDFDPYRTDLAKEVVYEIYNKYFDNDIFIKLKKINDDSKQYIAEGNFKYVPEINKVDYDLVTYQNLSNNTQIGINPISDGISNNTKINRGS